MALEHRVEGLDLAGGAGVTVEQEALGGVVPAEPVLDDLVGDLVGHVAARGEDVLDLETELGLVLDVGPEDVTGRDGRDGQALGEASGLRALTGAGRAEHDQSH